MINERRPQFFKKRKTSIFSKKEDYLNFFKKGRLPQFFQKRKTTSIFSKKEDFLNFFKKGRLPQSLGSARQPLIFVTNRRRPQFYGKISKFVRYILSFFEKTKGA